MMGYLHENHGITLFIRTPEGTCPQCATMHDPKHPHNRASLAYQYKFYDQYGRWPTWEDAMAHCAEEIKEYWKQALRERGVEI